MSLGGVLAAVAVFRFVGLIRHPDQYAKGSLAASGLIEIGFCALGAILIAGNALALRDRTRKRAFRALAEDLRAGK